MRKEPDSAGGRSSADSIPSIGEVDLPSWFRQFRAGSAVIAVAAAWTREAREGMSEEKDAWVRGLWREVLRAEPGARGARIFWNQVFFVIPSGTVADVKTMFKDVLTSLHDPRLETYCVLSILDKVDGAGAVTLLDEMQGEVAASWNFRRASVFKDKLLDGEEYRPA